MELRCNSQGAWPQASIHPCIRRIEWQTPAPLRLRDPYARIDSVLRCRNRGALSYHQITPTA